MRRLTALLLAATAAACGGSSGGGGGPGPREATPLPAGGPVPVTAFAQTVADTAGLGEVFPGQANTWVLDRDFALAQGYGLQYASALGLFVGTPSVPLSHGSLLTDLFGGALDPFPYDQDADEVVFLTPAFGAADGVRTAVASDGVSAGVPALSGTRSGYLNGTSSSARSGATTSSRPSPPTRPSSPSRTSSPASTTRSPPAGSPTEGSTASGSRTTCSPTTT